MNKKVLFLTQAGLIAALYVVLTLLANALGLANYAIQIRFSEALTILPFFTPAAIPGLLIGCLLSNWLTNCIIWDIIFGSLATLLGAIGTYFLAHRKPKNPKYSIVNEICCTIPPILANTIIVPFILAYAYHLEGGVPFFMLTVCIGEIISCGIFGIILLKALKKRSRQIFQ